MGTQRDKDVELERLRAENADVRRRNAELERRVSELERLIKPLGGAAGTERLDAAYSLRPEEQRQAAKAGGKQRSARRGRMTTQEKLDRAERVEIVLPKGFAIEDCRLFTVVPCGVSSRAARCWWRMSFIVVRRGSVARLPVCCRGASSGWRF